MKLNDFISITELARLTGRTRPTLYKYVRDYSDGNYDDIPYTFLMLLQKAEEPEATRRELLEYCEQHYSAGYGSGKAELRELIELISANAERLDLKELKAYIEKRLAR